MKRGNKWLVAVGLVLILAGLCLVLLTGFGNQQRLRQAGLLVQQIEAVLPERTAGIPEELTSMDMSALSLQGQSFVGLVEIPSYGVKLPLCGSWQPGRTGKYPCRFSGTVYNDSLIIGGGAGQFACLDTVGHGDVVTVTDMQGRVFTYRVSNIRRADNASAETLQRGDGRLVLFMRDLYTMEYVIVECI